MGGIPGAFLGTVVAVMLGTAPAPAQVLPATPQVGDLLDYALSNGDKATIKVVRIRAQGDQTLATLERTVDHEGARVVERLLVVRTDQGVAFKLASGALATPIVCYLTQASVNDTWTAQKGSYRDTAGMLVAYRITARLEAVETVRVKAGTFPGCCRIAYRTALDPSSGAPATDLVLWYKPEVGIIKTRSVSGDEAIETELTGYRLAGYGGTQGPQHERRSAVP